SWTSRYASSGMTAPGGMKRLFIVRRTVPRPREIFYRARERSGRASGGDHARQDLRRKLARRRRRAAVDELGPGREEIAVVVQGHAGRPGADPVRRLVDGESVAERLRALRERARANAARLDDRALDLIELGDDLAVDENEAPARVAHDAAA